MIFIQQSNRWPTEGLHKKTQNFNELTQCWCQGVFERKTKHRSAWFSHNAASSSRASIRPIKYMQTQIIPGRLQHDRPISSVYPLIIWTRINDCFQMIQSCKILSHTIIKTLFSVLVTEKPGNLRIYNSNWTWNWSPVSVSFALEALSLNITQVSYWTTFQTSCDALIYTS